RRHPSMARSWQAAKPRGPPHRPPALPCTAGATPRASCRSPTSRRRDATTRWSMSPRSNAATSSTRIARPKPLPEHRGRLPRDAWQNARPAAPSLPMRLSQFHLRTEKETPADAEIVSHQLMLRAGMVRRLAAGLYTWSPLGLRVLRKVEAIVREEMDRAGAIEMAMPSEQPKELWEETGRWEKFGPQLLKIRDRKEQHYCFTPTAEEAVTDFFRHEFASYKQLPVNFYQVTSKFRDEIRPRFGVMRAREFLMKDAYSFHVTDGDLEREYRNMYDTYTRIFTRLGLKFRAVAADTGAIGGSASHEFHVLADSGEDAL